MERRSIAELRAGDFVEDEVYLVKSKDLRNTTQGNLYIHAVLLDKTGQMLARQWQASEAGFKSMTEGGFTRFKGRVESYKGNLQFIIDAMRPAEPGSYEVADFLPATDKDVDAMWTRFLEVLDTIKHPELSALVSEFLADETLMAGFRKAPAAMAMHHAYIGGLLEHTLNLFELATRVIPLYPRLSLDLVLTGLFLHDIGKVAELSYETSIAYTDHGQLVGHITMATIWIDRKARAIAEKTGEPLSEDVICSLQHIILSHHGQYEFGSPKLPATPEAIAVHYLDNLDAKVNMYLSDIDRHPEADAHWTNYKTALQTKLYRKDVMGTRKG